MQKNSDASMREISVQMSFEFWKSLCDALQHKVTDFGIYDLNNDFETFSFDLLDLKVK